MKTDCSTAKGSLILVSASQRRKSLVASFEPSVQVVAPSGHEGSRREGETPEQMVVRIALAKSRDLDVEVFADAFLSADTIVVLGEDVLGKPSTSSDATEMLKSLRGRTHRVVTGVVLVEEVSGRCSYRVNSSDVEIRMITDEEIEEYVVSGEPFDKAGGYAVQDPSFKPAVSVRGCYLNVVGLPMCDVVELIEEVGINVSLSTGWEPPKDCLDCPLTCNSGRITT